jgi:hypothetical protein
MNSPLVGYSNFPSHTATDAEKASMEYGLQVGLTIQYEWFKRDSNSCRFYSKWEEFHRLRLYARGEQSVAKYKAEMSVNGDLSYLNLSWEPIPVIPKFVDIVVNGMSNRMFSVKAYAQDPLATRQRTEYKDMVEADMVSKDFLNQVNEQFGINAFNVSQVDLPDSNEELDLYMQIKYKPGIEIAEEQAIRTILEDNGYYDIKKQSDYDMTVLGVAVQKQTYKHNEGIVIEYVDPAAWVHSYTESPYFEDCFYFGEVKQVHIGELLKIDPTLTKEDIEEISQTSSRWYGDYSIMKPYYDSVFDRDVVNLLYFNYKTDKSFVYKKKYLENGGSRVIRRDESFNPPEEMQLEGRFERIEKRIDVWYSGVLVLGTQKLIKWELLRNMVRPKSATQRAMPEYVAAAPRMYKGNIESLVRRMVTFADLIQLTHLKLQQVIARMVPDGVYIDADGLNEVDLGTGNTYNPQEALKLYFQTGSVIGRSYTQDGEFNNARIPIQPLNGSGAQAKIASLVNAYNQYLSMIRDVTGLNEARDGSSPDPNALVGVQKLAALNSNTATRHILEGGLFLTRKIAEAISLRISDVLEYSDMKEQFVEQIGKYNVSVLQEISNLHLHDFGIFIEISPDEEEKSSLEANIQMALSRDQITLEDAIEIRDLRSIKIANELLKVKRKNKEKRDMEVERQKMEMQTQSNIQSSQAAAQSKMQQLQMEAQSKSQLKQMETELDIKKMQMEAELKMQLMDKEFQYNMELAKVQSGTQREIDDAKEKAKDKRVSIQSTQQSQLINQRKNDTPPINFESTEDSMDGFSLAQFEPR